MSGGGKAVDKREKWSGARMLVKGGVEVCLSVGRQGGLIEKVRF